MILIRLTLQKPEISAGSNGPLRLVKGFLSFSYTLAKGTFERLDFEWASVVLCYLSGYFFYQIQGNRMHGVFVALWAEHLTGNQKVMGSEFLLLSWQNLSPVIKRLWVRFPSEENRQTEKTARCLFKNITAAVFVDVIVTLKKQIKQPRRHSMCDKKHIWKYQLLLYRWCVLDSIARAHWLNRGHVNEFKSNVARLVNISKIIDQPANIYASRLRAWKFNNCGLFCLCYITKQLMTAHEWNICTLKNVIHGFSEKQF